jgi:hypothetical protein
VTNITRTLIALALAAAPLNAQTLKGSPASVDKMYNTAHARDLQFFPTPQDIYDAVRSGELKLISITNDVDLEKMTYPFVLPNTLRFVDSLAAVYHKECGERIVVTSGARPLDKQPGNASPKSVHPTGMAVDFRKPRTPACLGWMRKNLVMLEDRGVIEATEEMHPPHFHVAVLQQHPEPHIQLTNVAAGDISIPGSATKGAAKKAPAKASKPAAKHAKSHKSHKKKAT